MAKKSSGKASAKPAGKAARAVVKAKPPARVAAVVKAAKSAPGKVGKPASVPNKAITKTTVAAKSAAKSIVASFPKAGSKAVMNIVAAAKKAPAVVKKVVQRVSLKAASTTMKPSANAALAKKVSSALKQFGSQPAKAVTTSCPFAKVTSLTRSFLKDVSENPMSYLHQGKEVVSALKDLRNLNVHLVNGRLYASGMKTAFDGAKGIPGATTVLKITGKSFVDGIKSGTGSVVLGLGKTGAIAAAISMADELISQKRAGHFEPSRTAAKGGTGFVKGIVTGVAYSAAVAGTVAAFAAAGATAPVWVPVVAGVAASAAIGYALDKVDERYKITDNLAKGISSLGQTVNNYVGSFFKGSGPAPARGPP